jgi:NAD(P)-dependent dehydrogenase (short-subunit alcohol dehydrogenase family)
MENRDALIRGALLAAAGIGAGFAARALLVRRDGDLGGGVVLITGGSRGLGLALARAFAKEGLRVAICARDSAELERARQDLEERNAQVFSVECDVGDQDQVKSMIDRVLDHYGQIDILVNNAGEIQVGPLDSMSIDDIDKAMRVMFWGTVYPTLALLPHMRQRRTGRIVNITSIGGKVAVPHLLPYTCAKFAAVGFSEGLHAELAGKGVKVVTIAPGLMRTGSYQNAWFKGNQDREAAWFGLSSSLPGFTISGERAAREIVDATRRGESERILSAPANLLSMFHGLFPGATADLLGAVARLLLPSGQEKRSKRGRDTRALREFPWFRAATILGRIAAERYLQPRTT